MYALPLHWVRLCAGMLIYMYNIQVMPAHDAFSVEHPLPSPMILQIYRRSFAALRQHMVYEVIEGRG